jgi:hypothetical protein
MGNLLPFQCYLQTISQLEIRIAELRAWLSQMEAQLMKPLVFAAFSKEVVEAKLHEHEVNNLEKSSLPFVCIFAVVSF